MGDAATPMDIDRKTEELNPNNYNPNSTRTLNRIDAQVEKRDRTLAEFLSMMDDYTPLIPDIVTDYYLSKSGFECDDVKIKRLLALAAQKFVADVATDAYQYCKIRQQSSREKKTGSKEKKTVLTMEDLSSAMGEHGLNVKKPDFYCA